MTTDIATERRDHIALPGRLALCLIGPFSGFAQVGLSPILPRLTEHFAATPNAAAIVRLMMSSLSFTMIIGSLGAGLLAARFGTQRLLFASLGLYALAGAAGALIDNLDLLVVSRMVLGTATAAWGVLVASTLTTYIAPEIRDRWLGFYIVSGTFGLFPFIMLAGALGKGDWRLVFLIHLTIVIPTVVLFLVMRGGLPQAFKAAASPAHGRYQIASVPWKLAFFSLVTGSVGATPIFFLPFHLASIGESAPERIALVIMAMSIGGGMSAFFYGGLRGRLSVTQIFAIGFLLVGTGLLVTVLAPIYSGVLLGGFIANLGFGAIAPNLVAFVAHAVPPDRRTATLGYARAASYAGPMLLQLSLEPMSKGFGVAAAIGIIALVAFLGIPLSVKARGWAYQAPSS